MFELVSKIGLSVILNIFQLIIGVVLSFALFRLFAKMGDSFKKRRGNDVVYILAASLFGALLPLEIYGVLPVAVMFIRLGSKKHTVLPMLFSNILFNMLVPFNDPSFVWRNGYARLILAVSLGFLSGLLLKGLFPGKGALRIDSPEPSPEPAGAKTLLGSIHYNITSLGVFLVIGVILNVIFNEYVIFNLTDTVFSFSLTASVTRFLGSFNIVHPLFLLGIGIVNSLVNFTRLSALAAVLKLKSIILFYLFYGICAFLLALSIFLR